MPIGLAQIWLIQQVGQLDHALQHIHQEPRQPHALPLAPDTHEVHPVVPVPCPHQGQPLGSNSQPARDRAPAVLKQCVVFPRDLRCGEGFALIVFQQRGVEEGNLRAQDVHIAGDPDVVSDDVGKPQEIIGDPRADTGAVRRMPPVLDIAFLELTARREQDVLSRQLGIRVDERHDVLQLIAEAERAAGLVQGGTPPDPAAEALGTEANG